MTLSGLRSLDKSAVVCFLFVVSGKRGPQGRKLLVGFQPAKALLGFVHGRSGPAQGHRGRTPALHIAGDATHGAHHVLDDVGAGERAPQLGRQTEPAHREDLIQSLEDALRDAGSVALQALGEVADQLLRLLRVVELPGLAQRTPDRSMQSWRETLHDVPSLVNLAA